jgi:hypothetical protein
MNFEQFFEAATGHRPYQYQCRLACGEQEPGEDRAEWLAHGAECSSRLINIPTGLGKTAADSRRKGAALAGARREGDWHQLATDNNTASIGLRRLP